jgi:hypothetical protein
VVIGAISDAPTAPKARCSLEYFALLLLWGLTLTAAVVCLTVEFVLGLFFNPNKADVESRIQLGRRLVLRPEQGGCGKPNPTGRMWKAESVLGLFSPKNSFMRAVNDLRMWKAESVLGLFFDPNKADVGTMDARKLLREIGSQPPFDLPNPPEEHPGTQGGTAPSA